LKGGSEYSSPSKVDFEEAVIHNKQLAEELQHVKTQMKEDQGTLMAQVNQWQNAHQEECDKVKVLDDEVKVLEDKVKVLEVFPLPLPSCHPFPFLLISLLVPFSPPFISLSALPSLSSFLPFIRLSLPFSFPSIVPPSFRPSSVCFSFRPSVLPFPCFLFLSFLLSSVCIPSESFLILQSPRITPPSMFLSLCRCPPAGTLHVVVTRGDEGA